MRKVILTLIMAIVSMSLFAAKPMSGNPIIPQSVGWYADPHAMIYNHQWWIFPTTSIAFGKQNSMDCFSSSDLCHWTRHPNILTSETVKWVKNSLWAPASIERGGRYYLFFGANNIPYGDKFGGIGVAVANHPEGPYTDLIGAPLISTVANGAQPIDQCLLVDDDGATYMYYGGWNHCNVVKLKPDFKGVEEFSYNGVIYNQGGSTDPEKVRFMEVTPDSEPSYTEGSFVFKRKGIYYFMWSEGNYTDATYNVAYAMSDSPFGPFRREGTVLLKNESVGSGAGHHSVVNIPGTNEWYLFYHRHPSADSGGNDRVVCVERMHFDHKGRIVPMMITNEGVKARTLR